MTCCSGAPGADFAGVVVKVGAKVTKFSVGQPVFGVAPGCLKSYVTTDATLVGPLPRGFSFESGAALPVIGTTVELCLADIAQVQRGQRVLIHASTGGIGLMAVQFCQRPSVNAEVYATVGSKEKINFLMENFGVDKIASSRDPKLFRSTMEKLLEGEKFDVVLNSFSGDFISHSVDLLKEGGHFIEIGKRDIWSKVKMDKYRPDVKYSIVAVDQMTFDDPGWFSRQLLRLSELAESGDVKPIPLSVFDLSPGLSPESSSAGIVEAFRFLQRAQHIGKVVVRLPDPLAHRNLKSMHCRNALQSINQTTHSAADQTLLVVGGLGALGLVLTQWLIDQGATRIVLCSRSGAASQTPTVSWLSSSFDLVEHRDSSTIYRMGCVRVAVIACDVSDKPSVMKLFSQTIPFQLQFPEVGGIFHAAGVLHDLSINNQTLESIEDVFKSKVVGGWNLHDVCEELGLNANLDIFAVFSSMSSLFGNFSQANYSAANASLDALVEARRRSGYAGLSVQWGPWIEQGMAASLKMHLDKAGVMGISNDLGLRVLHDSICCTSAIVPIEQFDGTNVSEKSTIGCVTINRGLFLERYGHQIPGALREFEASATTSQETTLSSEALEKLKSMDDDGIRQYVEAVVVTSARNVTGGESGIPLDVPITESGIDSLAAVEFGNELSSRLGVKLPTSALFNHPTLRLLQKYLVEKVTAAARSTSTGAFEKVLPLRSSVQIPISRDGDLLSGGNGLNSYAIVGLSAMLPGNSDGVGMFWEMLLNKTDCIRPIPRMRFNVADMYDPDPQALRKCYVREASLVDNPDAFDRRFFNISTSEAQVMDPQQRRILELSYDAFVDSGMNRSSLIGRQIAVYVGCCNFDWVCLDEWRVHESPYCSTGTALSLTANRISYAMGIRGPSMTIDTACSSSLFAMNAALDKLELDQTVEAALVGGVSMIIAPHAFVGFCRTRMLSPTCRCKTFDAAADGYVRGEGTGAAVIMRLGQAEEAIRRAGGAEGAGAENMPIRRIVAVIRGSGVNHDGQSASLTAPNGLSQEEVIRKALSQSKMKPGDITLIECHGTGTALGDPIETAAIKAVYCNRQECRVKNSPRVVDTVPLYLAAVKTNIGHLEGSAGIAGFIKLCMAIQTRTIPPNLHFRKLNPQIDFEAYDMRIPVETESLEEARRQAGDRLVGGVSAFGFGGANAHVIVQEYLPIATSSPKDEDQKGENKLVYMFTGQGSQYVGVAKELLEQEEVFRDAFRLCCERALELAGVSLEDVVYPKSSENTSDINNTRYAQLVVFSIEYALLRLIQSRGTKPAAVLGHSLGEYCAAVAAGVMSIDDAIKVVAFRSGLMASTPPNGGVMVACRVKESTVLDALQTLRRESSEPNYLGTVSIAAVNGLNNIVLSGKQSEVQVVLKALKIDQKSKSLSVSHAFHSPLVEPTVEPLLNFFKSESIKLNVPDSSVVFISTVTGQPETDALTDPLYWAGHITRTVRFADAVSNAVKGGGRLILEIGPNPTLVNMARLETDKALAIKWRCCLAKGKNSVETFKAALSSVESAFQQKMVREIPDDVVEDNWGFRKRRWNREKFTWGSIEISNSPGRSSPNRTPTHLRQRFGTPQVDVLPMPDLSDEEIWKICVKAFDEVLADVKDASSIQPDTLLAEWLQDLDSLAAVEFYEVLESRLAIQVPVTILFDHLTFGSMHQSVCSLFHQTQDKERQNTVLIGEKSLSPVLSNEGCQIVVTSMACRLPGNSNSPEQFWSMLAEQRSGFTEIPKSRFNIDLVYQPFDTQHYVEGRTYSRHAALITSVDQFANKKFGISDSDAANIDPHHRIMLEVVSNAWAGSGEALDRLKNPGLFIGFSDEQEWPLVQLNGGLKPSRKHNPLDRHGGLLTTIESTMTGAAPCMLANRISHALNFTGPSMTIDSGCSSFGVAVSTAFEALRQGTCYNAVVGSVSLLLTPITLIGFCANRYLCSEDRVHSFDIKSSGTLRGEGAAAFVFKAVHSGESLPQNSLAIIRSSVSNNNGRAPSLTAFFRPAQVALHAACLNAGRCTSSDVSYVETHGTGILLSDVVEMAALKETFSSPRSHPLILGALHPNIGHSNAALGAAQLLKIILSLSKGFASPILGFTSPHQHLDLRNFDVQFPTEMTPIPVGLKGSRIGLINSFGMGGTNAAILVESISGETTDKNIADQSDVMEDVEGKQTFAWKSVDASIAMGSLLATQTGHEADPLTDVNFLVKHFEDLMKTTDEEEMKSESNSEQFRRSTSYHTVMVVMENVTDGVLEGALLKHLTGTENVNRVLCLLSCKNVSINTLDGLKFVRDILTRAGTVDVELSLRKITLLIADVSCVYFTLGRPLFVSLAKMVDRLIVVGFHRPSSPTKSSSYASIQNHIVSSLRYLLEFIATGYRQSSLSSLSVPQVELFTDIHSTPSMLCGFRPSISMEDITSFESMSNVFSTDMFGFSWSQWVIENVLLRLPSLRCHIHRVGLSLGTFGASSQGDLISAILSARAIPDGIILDIVVEEELAERVVSSFEFANTCLMNLLAGACSCI